MPGALPNAAVDQAYSPPADGISLANIPKLIADRSVKTVATMSTKPMPIPTLSVIGPKSA